jgi:hypothetical protein
MAKNRSARSARGTIFRTCRVHVKLEANLGKGEPVKHKAVRYKAVRHNRHPSPILGEGPGVRAEGG